MMSLSFLIELLWRNAFAGYYTTILNIRMSIVVDLGIPKQLLSFLFSSRGISRTDHEGICW